MAPYKQTHSTPMKLLFLDFLFRLSAVEVQVQRLYYDSLLFCAKEAGFTWRVWKEEEGCYGH